MLTDNYRNLRGPAYDDDCQCHCSGRAAEFQDALDEIHFLLNGQTASTVTDILLDHPQTGRRVVIDTKFNAVVTQGWYREATLRSGYVYQIYAYLRSQEENDDPFAANASGLLLHPSIGDMVDESVVIQGHEIRFATVDLAASARDIRAQLLRVLDIAIAA